jgi:hypothetical protein
MTTSEKPQVINGWSLYEKKILADIERLERNQIRIFKRQDEHSVKLATIFVRVSMLAALMAALMSVFLRELPKLM